jgi:hypothetical protein
MVRCGGGAAAPAAAPAACIAQQPRRPPLSACLSTPIFLGTARPAAPRGAPTGLLEHAALLKHATLQPACCRDIGAALTSSDAHDVHHHRRRCRRLLDSTADQQQPLDVGRWQYWGWRCCCCCGCCLPPSTGMLVRRHAPRAHLPSTAASDVVDHI